MLTAQRLSLGALTLPFRLLLVLPSCSVCLPPAASAKEGASRERSFDLPATDAEAPSSSFPSSPAKGAIAGTDVVKVSDQAVKGELTPRDAWSKCSRHRLVAAKIARAELSPSARKPRPKQKTAQGRRKRATAGEQQQREH